MNVPAFAGLYNAYNETTRLFISHRNIERIDLELSHLDLNMLALLTGPDGYRFRDSFRPTPDQLLRTWSVPVEAQLNERRYELLLLSEQGPSGVENIQCLGAPDTRLVVGAEARVDLEDPTPTRVRTEPNLGGQIVTSLEPGIEFVIRSGPICSDGYLWWQIYSETQNVEGWMAEGTLASYFIEPLSFPPPPSVDAGEELPPLTPGIYFLQATSPQTAAENYEPQRHVLIVATANVTMKFSPDQALAWVTDMQSGLPIAGVPVTVYDGEFNAIANGITDSSGLAQFDIPRLENLYSILYTVVQTGKHFGYVNTDFSQGIEPWYFDLPANYQPSRYSVYLYTDRPIYRPDQPVYFRGVLRSRDDVEYMPVTGVDQIFVTVSDVESQIVYEDYVDLTPYGTFSGQFDLDEGASLGYYRLTAILPAELEVANEYGREFSRGFNVAEYRAPEFQVTLTPAADAVVQGETVQVDVESRYFFGAPVSDAQITWNVFTENYFFNAYRGPEFWSFIDYNYDSGPSAYYGGEREPIANGESMTNAEGRFLIELPADLGEATQSQQYIIEAVVTDESDQLVAGRTTIIIHQGEVYLGLAPERYVYTAGEEASFRMLSVDWDGETIGGQEVDYRIVERRWFNVQEKDPGGRTVWRWDVEEIEVDSGTVATGDDGRALVTFTPPNGGVYKIYGVTQDSRNNTVNSSAFMWVSGQDYVSWRQQNSNRIDLITDADDYAIGDTAEILIASPFQGSTVALVTVERGSIFHTEVIEMESNSYVYRLPIEEAYAPNIFVSVVLVKGVDETNPYTQFRVGMSQLNVETRRLEMNVEVTPEIPEGVTPGPGDTLTISVSTTDWQGNPVSAEVGIGVTDLAVLTLAPSNAPPLMSYFYGQQGVSVRTSASLTLSVDQVTQTIIDTVKGGGGGGPESGIFDIRQEFVDTPLWGPSVVTDESGTAQVEITLPDNLTTWRIDARAVTTGIDSPMLVGQTTTDFLSTKPLLIRPITPRFMIVGDQATFGAIVNNNTDIEQVVDVLMEGTGFIVLENAPLTQTVTVPAGGRVRVNWRVNVLDVPTVDVFFAVQNADSSLTDASKPPLGQGDEQLLPVYKYAAPETVGTAGTLEGPDAISFTEVVALPERIDVSRGSLNIRLDRSLAGPTLDGLDYLENYPHQCIEQTISRFLPNVMTMRALTALNQSNPALEENLRTQVNFGLQRIYAQQKIDGGWGWFPNDESNPITTAYALIGLVEAQNSGFTIDTDVIRRALGYLNDYLLETDRSVSTGESWMLNRRAFILYALTRSGQGNASRLAALYNVRSRLNLDAQAYMTMSMKIMNSTDPRLDTLMNDFVTAATLSATGTHWEDRPDFRNWTTNTRSTALILMAMVQHDPGNDLLPGAVRWLMVARQADAWETTQETAWAVMALTEWMVASGELDADYDFAVRLNGDIVAEDSANSGNVKESEALVVEVAELLVDEANQLVLIKDEGPGNLYYTAHITSYIEVPAIEPVSRGIIISRQYHLAGDDDRTPVTSAAVGDEMVVTLTIIAPRNLHYVVIEDPIPAGSESIDPNLVTTSVTGQRPTLERSDPLSRGWGWWWFSRTEFRDEKVVMYATYLPRGTYTYTYTLRMGLEGEYNVIPPTGQEFYFPEVYGRGAGMLFTIEPEPEGVIEPES